MVETRSRPLEALKVLELAGIGPVPFAGMLLQQMGAEVTRIERPGGLDSVIPIDGDPINRGKARVDLNLKRREGRDAFLALASACDVVIEGNRPGVLERLGLGPEVLLERNSKLILGRMTGWGQDGPFAAMAGHDLNYIGLTGALHAIGARDGPPAIPLNLVGDYGGGALYLVVGVLAALCEVRSGGAGQVIDAAIVDGTCHLLSGVFASMALDLWVDRRGSNYMDGGTPFYSIYETSDARHVAVTAVEARFYAVFLQILGIDEDPSAQHDETRWDALRSKISERFRTRTQEQWAAVFDGSDACVTPILNLTEATSHPHIAARGSLAISDGHAWPSPAPRFHRP